MARHHLMLLGPPAVGKLAIARELSRLLCYPVFDNAKTVDIAVLIYRFGSPRFRQYRDLLRRDFYERAADSHLGGLISTYCYRGPHNAAYLDSVDRVMAEAGWVNHGFLLLATREVLLERISNPSRRCKSTLTSKAALAAWIDSSPAHRSAHSDLTAKLDVSRLSPGQAARQIIERMAIE